MQCTQTLHLHSNDLPSLDSFAARLKDGHSQALGQIICIHQICRTLENQNPSIRILDWIIHMLSEEVILNIEILGSWRDSLICGKQVSTLVVFKDGTVDLRRFCRKIQMIKNKGNHITYGNHSFHSMGQSNILSM